MQAQSLSDIISINSHSSIRIALDQILYIDPFHLTEQTRDADIIFITHEHYDHFSPEDILKIVQPETVFVMPETMTGTANKAGIPDGSIVAVRPNGRYTVRGISFETVPAYNLNKAYHPKENKWVGYIIEAGKKRVYICGDTDALPENTHVRCDILIAPVGGTYTMDAAEAAAFANAVRPEIAIPSHYGDIVGTPYDGMAFTRGIRDGIQTRLLIAKED